MSLCVDLSVCLSCSLCVNKHDCICVLDFDWMTLVLDLDPDLYLRIKSEVSKFQGFHKLERHQHNVDTDRQTDVTERITRPHSWVS